MRSRDLFGGAQAAPEESFRPKGWAAKSAVLLIVGALTASGQMQRALPLFFIESHRFAESGGNFLIRTPGLQAAFSARGVEWVSAKGQISLRFRNAASDVRIQGDTELPGNANIFDGSSPGQWQRGLRTFQGVVYQGLYRGIDVAYHATDSSLKSQFNVAPGADPGQIRLEYSGLVSVNSEGSLMIRSGDALLRENAPQIYQDLPAGRKKVSGRFKKLDAHTAGFEIGPFDHGRLLVIDPVISYSTYLGGSGLGAVTAVALDSAGSLYAAGWTEALNFPVSNAAQATNQGGVDAFVVKLNPTGTAIIYATYIGGRSDDRATGIGVDSAGKAYVTGATTSSNFPLVSSLRPFIGGAKDAFVLSLGANGDTLSYSTYLGGTDVDNATAIAVDGAGNAYIAGDTQSANFPVAGAFQSTNHGGFDVFVTKLNPAGQIVFSTYLGGNAAEHAGGIAIDSNSNIYIAGGTFSANFPTQSPIQATIGGTQDAFISKLRADGTALIYSTYLGGNGQFTIEQANAVAVNTAGNAFVAGVTNSFNFPVTGGAYQVLFNGVEDAFVCKLNVAGSALDYSTFLGGTNFDWAWGLGIDGAGNAYAAGYTSSVDFAIIGGVQAGFGGLYDSFVTRLSPNGNSIGFSTFYGGAGNDSANAIAVDTNGNMFVGGQTSSLNLPLANAIQNVNIGGSIGWVARLGVTAPPAQQPSVISLTPSSGSGNTATFSATFTDTAGAAALTTVGFLMNSSASTSLACYVAYDRANNRFLLAKDDPAAGSFTIIPGGGAEQNSQCTLNGTQSSVVIGGSSITITVSFTFRPPFSGARSLYLFATDAGASTGFVAKGTWTVTVPPPAPSADTVSPNSGLGSNQTFTFVFSDTQDAFNLTGMAMLFNTSTALQNACYIGVDRNQSTISLLYDSALGASTRSIVSTNTLQNSQCSVGAATIVASGLSQIVTVNITFKGPFSGAKNTYMLASLGYVNTGLVQRGTYTVAAGGVAVADSVVPGSGFGASQRFSFTISDQGGSSFLTGMAMLFNSSFSTTNACLLGYDRNTNRVSLSYDIPANGSSPVAPNSSTVVSNSQCILQGANTTVVVGTTSLVVTVDLSFSAAWFGAKSIWLLGAENGSNTGWVPVGSWTVSGGAPSADAVSPASGSGSQPSFTFTVSDATSQSNISAISMLLTTGSPVNTSNACYLVYNRANATIGLYNDAATAVTTKGIGSSTTVQNSQCSVGYTVMNTSGNSVLFSINLLLKPAFSGAKSVYLQAHTPAATSGWVARGTWTAP